MKKIVLFTLLTVMSSTLFGQDSKDLPYSIINFIRSGNFFGSACRSDIILPNQRQFNLSNNSTVKYKVFSEGEIAITVEKYCPGVNGGPSSSSSEQISINIKRGNEYYVFYNAGSFNVVKKSKVQKFLNRQKNVMKQEENIEFPINRNSIKDIAKKEGQGQGTCFLISSDGYLITNFHCIENAKEITIKGIDGDFTTRYGATVVASDPSNDLALIKISNKNISFTNPPFSIRSNGVAQAEKVYAIGYPNAAVMGEEIKITEGIISAKSGVQGDISKFQISAAVNSGNSGGPLIDEEGNLIGIIYAKSSIAESAGYAIKASYLETFLKNVDDFNLPVLTNLIKDKSLPQKIEILKRNIYILETK